MKYCTVTEMYTQLLWNQTSTVASITGTSAQSPGPFDDCTSYTNFTKIFAIVLAVITSYSVVVLILYTWKKRKCKNVPRTNHLSLLSAVFALLFCSVTLFIIWTDLPNSVLVWLQAAFYWIGISLTYTILWARQRRFYSDELLSSKVGKFHKVWSSVVIIGIYLFLAALIITFQRKLKTNSCVNLGNFNEILPTTLSFLVVCFAFQVSLFYLLINPLREDGGTKLSDILCCRLKLDIYKMVVRLAFCAMACVFTTLLTCVIILLNSANLITTYWGNLLALDLIINAMSIVCSFKDWKCRLFPFCETAESKQIVGDTNNTVDVSTA
ncbi:uncharacterized protein LOC143463118 [Clavelina lepadiformis]|uniref:uncharacterized protein LOC143463118 n=1 Tax=Clavelina lepadiformis TaxID=159417 RepID=UPI004041E8EA